MMLEGSEGISYLDIRERLIHEEGRASSKSLCLVPGPAVPLVWLESSIGGRNQNDSVEPDYRGLFFTVREVEPI